MKLGALVSVFPHERSPRRGLRAAERFRDTQK